MKKYLLLAGVGFCCVSGAAWAAIDCATPPKCADLGFTMTADDCVNHSILKCPFDQTQIYCDLSCADLGYLSTSCAPGQTSTECPLDSSKMKCSGKSYAQQCIEKGYDKYNESPQGGVCLLGQTRKKCDLDERYYTCEGEATTEPTVSTCASMGYFTLSNLNCDCQYGYTSAGVSGTDGACYRCGTSTECVGPNGMTKCAGCAGYTYSTDGYVPDPNGSGGNNTPGSDVNTNFSPSDPNLGAPAVKN